MLKENPPYVEGSRMMYRGQVCRILRCDKYGFVTIRILHTEQVFGVESKVLQSIELDEKNIDYWFPEFHENLDELLTVKENTWYLNNKLPIFNVHTLDSFLISFKLAAFEYEKNITNESTQHN
jgi:hypothetical protein